MYCLSLEDMIPNAFIEINSRSCVKVKEIPLDIIEGYGHEVAKKLQNSGNKIVYGLSRNDTIHFSEQYSDFFSINFGEYGVKSSVILNDGIEIEQLINRFRGYLPLDLLLAYIDDEVVQKGLLYNIASEIQNANHQKKLVR